MSIVLAANTISFSSLDLIAGEYDSSVLVMRHPQLRAFIYLLHGTEAIVWDADASKVAVRVRIPATMREGIVVPRGLEDDVTEEEYFLGRLAIAPADSNGLAVLAVDTKHLVLKANDSSILSAGKFSAPVSWCYRDGERVLCVTKATDSGGATSLIAYDAISREERHRWKYTSWNGESAGVSSRVRWESFHPREFVTVMLDKVADVAEPRAKGEGERSGEASKPPKGSIAVWDLRNGKVLWRVPSGSVEGIEAISDDGEKILMQTKGSLEVWNAATGGVLGRFGKGQLFPSGAAFSPCGRLVVASKHDAAPSTWDWKNGNEKHTYSRPGLEKQSQLLFSSDGARVVIASLDLCVYEFDTKTGQMIRKTAVINDPDAQKLHVECWTSIVNAVGG